MDTQRVLERYTRVAPQYDRVISFWTGVTFFPIECYWREAVAPMNVGEGDMMLGIGCGTGLNLPYHPQGVHVVGVDLSPRMLRRAATTGPALRTASLTGWPAENQKCWSGRSDSNRRPPEPHSGA
ncbi:MAG: class I SAM-dependent methyltransferase, partial [Dehalococcoidia bacterium]